MVLSAIWKEGKLGRAFLWGKFFGGMKTTQHCESMNFYLKKFLKANYPFCELVQHVDLGVQKMCHGELENNYISKHISPQLPPSTDPLRPYYEQCGNFLTRYIYYKVTVEISKDNAFLFTIC